MAPDFVVVGHINKAHGTKGELFIWPLTDRPEQVFAQGARLRLGDEDGNPIWIPETLLNVETVRTFRQGYLVRFDGIADRNAAERLLDQYLVTPFEPPSDRDPSEYYYHELLGLEVVTTANETVGRVCEVFELAPDHMLDVEGPGGSILVPLNARFVAEVDLEGGRITLDPPVGFLELQE